MNSARMFALTMRRRHFGRFSRSARPTSTGPPNRRRPPSLGIPLSKENSMNDALATKSKRALRRKGAVGRLFVLELSGGRIHSMGIDGSDRTVLVSDCHLPDGIAVDAGAGHIYWTNMGVPNLNDGSIERADL